MKMNSLTTAAVALLWFGGAVVAQQDQPPQPTPTAATSTAATPSKDAAAVNPSTAPSVCVIGVKVPEGKDVSPTAPPAPDAASPPPPAKNNEKTPVKGKAPAAGKVPPMQPDEPTAAAAPDASTTGKVLATGKDAAPKLKDLPQEVSESCLDGKIIINVSSRPFGYKIGDVVQIEMEIILKGGAQVDLDPLRQGKLMLDDKSTNQFEVAGTPFIKPGEVDGDKAFDIVVPVRNFVPSPSVGFTMQLPYAEAPAPGSAPAWKTLSTPEYTVVQYIEDVKGFKLPMVDGNAAGAAPRMPWALPLLSVVATLLFLTWPTILMLRFVNRARTYKTLERPAAAWLALQRAIKSGKELGFGLTHYRRIAEVLRKYLRVEYPGLEGMTLPEMEQLPDQPRANTIKKAFGKLERVLIEEKQLSPLEQSQLLEEIDVLVPRPFSI